MRVTLEGIKMNIKYTCFLVLFLFCITADQASARVIHTAKFNGHIYYLLDTDGTKWWLAAEQEAVSLGGHLGVCRSFSHPLSIGLK